MAWSKVLQYFNLGLLFEKKSIFFNFSLDPADTDIAVSEEFAVILQVALTKMVSAKCLNPDLINLDFWRRMPNKFKGIRYYEDTKKKHKEVANV